MNPSIQKDLFTLEKQERAMNLKFGVIYAKESQMTDDEFLSNQEGSKSFHNFLDLLGERINLKVSDLKFDNVWCHIIYLVNTKTKVHMPQKIKIHFTS